MIRTRPPEADPSGSRRGRRLLGLLTAGLLAGAVPVLAAPAAEAIDGGYTATNSDLAFVAEIRNTAVGGWCTGSLIHPSWVLTAVHCSVPTSVGDMTVRVGNTVRGTGGELRRITRIVRHPDYAGGHNDVALLELASPVTTVRPIRLAAPTEAHLWDGVQGGPFTQYDQGIATGWGQTATGSVPNQLQYTGVFIYPRQLDGLGIPTIPVSRGPCPGDSGGPLLVTVNGTYVQAGVLKGAACGSSGSYSIVGAGGNRDWILRQLTAVPYTSFGLADWDRDGHQDIVTRQNNTGELWLYPGQSVRGLSSVQRVLIGRGYAGYAPYGLGDWDRDGHQDLLTRQDSTGELWLHSGQSVRGLSAIQPARIGTGWNSHSSFDVADWDRDGHQDLLARDNDTGNLWLYRGASVRGISPNPRVLIGWGWGGYSSFGVADWERDGHQDIVTRYDADGYLWLYPGQSVRGVSSTPRVLIGWGW